MENRFALAAVLIPAVLFLSCQKDRDPTPTDSAGEDIDPPESISARYDTLAGIVSLTWEKNPHADLKGYAVYRNPSGSRLPELLRNSLIQDTLYSDTVYSDPSDTSVHSFEYRIKSLNSNLDQSAFSKPMAIRVVPPSWVKTFMRLSRSLDEATMNDTVTIKVAFNNRMRGHDSLIARIGSEIKAAKRLTGSSGEELFSFRTNSLGNSEIIVRIRDDGGASWTDSIGLSVVADPPKAEAQGDRFVFGNDTIHLQGGGQDRLGRIVKWEWRLGDSGSFQTVSEGDTAFAAASPAEPKNPEWYVLRVTDDDSLTASDSIRVKIYFPGENWVRASNQLPFWTYRDGGGIQCMQMDGRIWLIRSFLSSDGAYPVHVWSSGNGLDWDLVTEDAGFPTRAFFAAASWNGRLWVIGGTKNSLINYQDVWSSQDGKIWEKIADSTFMGADVQSGYAFAAQGKLWYVKKSGPGYPADRSKPGSLFQSEDGINWDSVGLAPFEGRFITGSAEFSGKIWLFGNGAGASSPDGKTWTEIPGRFQGSPHPAVFRNKLFVVNAISNGDNTFYTSDGIAWKSFRSNTIESAGHCFESFQDRLFEFGGAVKSGSFQGIFYTK